MCEAAGVQRREFVSVELEGTQLELRSPALKRWDGHVFGGACTLNLGRARLGTEYAFGAHVTCENGQEHLYILNLVWVEECDLNIIWSENTFRTTDLAGRYLSFTCCSWRADPRMTLRSATSK